MKWIEARTRKSSLHAETVNLIAKELFPELRSNWDSINGYLSNPESGPLNLKCPGYNNLLKDGGACGYLKAAERRAYWTQLQQLYIAINKYNRAINRSECDIIAHAIEVRGLLAGYFEKEGVS